MRYQIFIEFSLFLFLFCFLQFSKDIIQLGASKGAFGALRSDGLVVTWGDVRCGGEGLLYWQDAVLVPQYFRRRIRLQGLAFGHPALALTFWQWLEALPLKQKTAADERDCSDS